MTIPGFETVVCDAGEWIIGEFLLRHKLRMNGYLQLPDKYKQMMNVYGIAEKLDELREIKRRARKAVRALMEGSIFLPSLVLRKY